MDEPDSDTSGQLEAMGIRGARVPPVTTSPWYRLELALGAGIAGLFPLIYVALFALAVWAVYSVALRSPSNFSSPALKIGFSLGGCLLVLSLMKPLVARPGRTAEPHILEPHNEPLLYAFVRELAASAGMPTPSLIAVDCSVNCCCVFEGGVGGLFRSDLILQVGLPLVAGLRLDQLGGVLAHELAHAAQTEAPRSSRILWSVHAWLSRVACERDKIDEQILNWLETGGATARLGLPLAQLLFRLGRGVAWLLMKAAVAATCVFLRRAELEADRLQARVAGAAAFMSTVLDVNLLALAEQRALIELSRMKREGRLVDDYPGLIASVRRRYSAEFVQRLLVRVEESEGASFRTHPSDRERIAMARSEKNRGILPSDLPAALLFADCDALCRGVTLEFYDQELRLDRESFEIVPLRTVLPELP
jgi:hypothetical protein